jgi:hypothetical protein
MMSTSAFANPGGYDGYLKNPDGTYVVGDAYTSYVQNVDGTYVVGKK